MVHIHVQSVMAQKEKNHIKQLINKSMCAPEGFHYFINHVKQRLVVILDYNIRNGLDPCQTDILLLRELYNIYDDGSIDTFSETEPTIHVEQIGLFGQTVIEDKE